MMALASRIVSGEQDEAETVEEEFAQAQDAESKAEELLVDEDCRPVELVQGIGQHGNSHSEVPTNPSGPCSHGLSSWLQSRTGRRAARASFSPPTFPCSSGR